MNKIFYALLLAILFSQSVAAQTLSRVTSPANGSINAEAPILKVTVQAVTGAKRYTVQLNTKSDFTGTSLFMTSSVDYQRTLTFRNIKYYTKYFARVKTDINTTYGPTTSFVTKREMFAYVVTPSNGTSGVDYSLNEIVLRPVTHARKYMMQLSTSSDFTTGLKTYYSFEDFKNKIIVRDLHPGVKYYARAKTDVNTTWGQTTTFTNRQRGSMLRIWGLTSSVTDMFGGSLFSFSVDSLKYTVHYQDTGSTNYNADFVRGPDGFYGAVHRSYPDWSASTSIFKFNPANGYYQESSSLTNEADVWFMMASSGSLFATINGWDTQGKVRRIASDFSTYKDIRFFGATARDPVTYPVEHAGFLYGTTHTGGNSNWGTVYRMRPDGSSFQVLHHFDYRNGRFPHQITYGNDGYLYGTAADDQGGIIFRIKADGTDFRILRLFTGEDMNVVYEGTLLVKDRVIYGANGVLFRMNTDGTGFRILHRFLETPGAYPAFTPAMDHKGFLYGTTQGGGIHGNGIIYRIKADGTQFKKLFDFPAGPERPMGNIFVLEDTFTPPTSFSVASVEENAFDVYPNPSASSFRIKFGNTTSPTKIEVKDFNGTVMYSSVLNDDEVEIGEFLPKGIYVMTIVKDGKTSTTRLVKR
jgi:uncharacterized repeat protein (TIGR03803 family)